MCSGGEDRVRDDFSLTRRVEEGADRKALHAHVVRRGLTLVLLGAIYNGLLKFEVADQRYASVLGRIGLAYLGAAVIVMNTRVRGQIAWITGLLLGYWAALALIPVPGTSPVSRIPPVPRKRRLPSSDRGRQQSRSAVSY